MSFVTSMYCSPWYDEEGRYHNHDSNVCTSSYSCSNGHTWKEEHLPACPTCGRWWEKPPSPCQEASQAIIDEAPTGELQG